jgi:hypothetical protein
LVEQCLAHIDDKAGEGGRTFLKVHREKALAAADFHDRMRAFGASPFAFPGIPVSIKDLFDIAGEVTTAGSVALGNAAPAREDAPAVARLRAAGFIPIGRTSMTEFAFSGLGINPHYGTPLSPHDRSSGRIPGGSSSGAAVSISDGMALGALGTDTGGSCRIPAAFCGIVGFKPTWERVRNSPIGLSKTRSRIWRSITSRRASSPTRTRPTTRRDGVSTSTSINDVYLGEPQFDPWFEELNRRGATLFVHPTFTKAAQTLLNGLNPSVLEFMFDTTRMIANMVATGAKKRFSNIKIISTHGGGTIPLAGRAGHRAQAIRSLIANPARREGTQQRQLIIRATIWRKRSKMRPDLSLVCNCYESRIA